MALANAGGQCGGRGEGERERMATHLLAMVQALEVVVPQVSALRRLLRVHHALRKAESKLRKKKKKGRVVQWKARAPRRR